MRFGVILEPLWKLWTRKIPQIVRNKVMEALAQLKKKGLIRSYEYKVDGMAGEGNEAVVSVVVDGEFVAARTVTYNPSITRPSNVLPILEAELEQQLLSAGILSLLGDRHTRKHSLTNG
jgi:hypothetical protein